MIVNFNVKIRTGKRTKPGVEVYYTGWDRPVFIGDHETNKERLADYLVENIQNSMDFMWKLQKMKNESH